MIAAIKRPARIHKETAHTRRTVEIAVVTHFFGTHGGGIELVAERLIREVGCDENFHFTWMASDCDPASQIENQTTRPMKSWNFLEKLFGLPWPIWLPSNWRDMRQAIENSDMLWLHDSLYMGNILAMRMARKAGKPVMITQHIAPIPYKNFLTRTLMQLADRFITVPMLEKAHEVTFISDRVAEDYYKRVNFTRPIKIIPNGVDVRVFHQPITENRRFLRQQFALKNDQPVFLFVGRFVDKKGLSVLRRLAKLLPECRFWLAGSGPIKPEKWMLPNVHVLKGRKGQNLADLYQTADLLLMPSYGEGFPLVIQEAMACGLPVLCSPETAQGNINASKMLFTAQVWPASPERTAAVWYEKIRNFPRRLPLDRPDDSLANYALSFWDWVPIAAVYNQILSQLAKKRPTK